jgi:hypothetical protein
MNDSLISFDPTHSTDASLPSTSLPNNQSYGHVCVADNIACAIIVHHNMDATKNTTIECWGEGTESIPEWKEWLADGGAPSSSGNEAYEKLTCTSSRSDVCALRVTGKAYCFPNKTATWAGMPLVPYPSHHEPWRTIRATGSRFYGKFYYTNRCFFDT